MKDHSSISPSIQRSLRIIFWIEIIIVIIISLFDIIEWAFNIPVFRTGVFTGIPMMPLTAICFLFCATALIFNIIKPGRQNILTVFSRVSGVVVSLIGLLVVIICSIVLISNKEFTIAGFPFLNQTFGLDGRIALVTAFIFMVIGIVIVLQSILSRAMVNLAHGLLILPALLSYLVLLSNLLGVYHVHEIQVVPVALNTGIAFCSLCLAILCIHPESWLMKIFTGQYGGSLMARRLLPGVFILPVVIGWLRISGERTGLFESEVGVVLVAMTYTLCFLWLVWVAAGSVNKTDEKRLNSEATLHLAQQASRMGTWDWDITSGNLKWTPELFEVFGLDPKKDSADFVTWDRILHPDDKADAYEKIETALKEHISLDSTYRIISKDDKIRWISATGEGRYNDDNAPVRMLGICQDITDLKKLEDKVHYEARRAFMLSDLSKMFTEAGFKLSDIFNTIVQRVAEYIGEACIITKLSEDGKFLIPAAFYHPDPEARAVFDSIFPNVPIRLGEGYVGQVALTGKSILVSGISREQLKASIKPEFWPYLDRFGIHDYLIVPLKTEGRVIGTMGVMRLNPGHSYNAEDQALLEVIASRAAMAITNIQLYEALQKSHDELEQKVKERTSELNETLTELSNEQKRFRDVLDMLPSFVTLMNRDYQFTFKNKEFIERFGDSIGKRCYEHLFNRNEPCENCHTDEVLNKSNCAFWEWKGPDGLTYDVSEIPFTDTDGSKLVLKIGSDITNIKQAEADRIARQVAESANRAKSEFLANISHEIRTPMNSIIGFSDLLNSTITDEKQLSQVKAIQSSSKNLLTLINDILDLSKIEAGKMKIQPEPVSFHKLISEIENVIIHRARDKGIGFFIETEKDVPDTLLIDDTRLRQVLSNLLDNAVKFTDHGHVILTIDSLLKKEEKIDLILSIEDTGIGIPEDQQEMIFHAFNRQKGLAEKKYGGTGLGLTITRRLVELMGGSVNLTSEPGRGSIFTVILPDISIVHESGSAQREKIFDFRTIRFKKSRILIADDNFENRKLLIDLLGSSPLELIEAANGKEAVELATKYLPDLILMDLRMPEMSGYDATRILKSQESTRAIPIVALSASPKIVFNGQSSKDIFDDFIMKPVIIANLAEHLKKYLPHEVEESSLQELPVKPVQDLTDKQKQQAKELIGTLENEFLPVYRKALAKQVISQINLFGQNLIILGEQSGSGLLMDYGKDICSNAENFDVEHLMEKLRMFPEIIDRLKKSNES